MVLPAALLALSACMRLDGPGGIVAITVDTTITYQVMTGWQATAQAGQADPRYGHWRDALMERAAVDGVDRLRLDVRSGIEHSRDGYLELLTGRITEAQWRCFRYATVNDNPDPGVRADSGFHFTELDSTMVNVVLPLRDRLAAHGRTLGVTASYIAFTGQTCDHAAYDHAQPAEYAEFAVAVMTHLRDRFGVAPDTWEVINEPDNVAQWTPDAVIAAVPAVDSALRANGFQVTLVAPSSANTASALRYTRRLMQSAAGALVGQVGYHRYGGARTGTVRALGAIAAKHGISSAMTEHIGSGLSDLAEDVTVGMASTWSQFTLAYPTTDNGAQYYPIRGATVETGREMKYLRHLFRHVRRGDVRVEARSARAVVTPMAFRRPGGSDVLVLACRRGVQAAITGLRAGRYLVEGETAAGSEPGRELAVGSDGTAVVSIQAAGILVVHPAVP